MKRRVFGICYNHQIERAADVAMLLKEKLQTFEENVSTINIDNLKNGFDFVFVIGGDGTILKTARFYAKYQTPIFGVNLGRLGFLSQSSVEMLDDSVNRIINKDYIVENRVMLQTSNYLALNDIVIKGSATGRTSRFSLKINDNPVCDYLADGIIVATPTGSTAYGCRWSGFITEFKCFCYSSDLSAYNDGSPACCA